MREDKRNALSPDGGPKQRGRAGLLAAGRDTRLRSVGNDEREQTLNQLLTELDGFESGAGSEAGPVICIAATNRPDVRAFMHPLLRC